MAKAAKKRKTAEIFKKVASSEIALYTVEANPPIYSRRSNEQVQEALQAVRDLLPRVKSGMAFIIPFTHKGSIKKFLAADYPEYRFIFTRVLGNDKVMRVYKHDIKK